MDNSRRSNFMGEINARQYNVRPRSVQPNNPTRIKPNIRTNNTHPQYKRTFKNSVKTFMKRYKVPIAITVLAAAGLITLGAVNNNTEKNIDNVHAAYEYTENVLSIDERAVNIEGYQDYIDRIAAFDKTFEESNKESFHDFVKALGIEDKVLDSEQITNLALEVFKVAFAEKNGINPRSVTIENREPDITQMSKEFNYKMGKYKCMSITYKTSDGQEEKLITDYLAEGYFSLGMFEPTGDTIQYSNDIPKTEYDVLNTIIKSQTDETNTRKALKALKVAQEYAEKVKGEIEQEQSGVERDD